MILFISHDASRTGAPIVLLHLLRWIKDNTVIQFEILLKNGGELLHEFESISPTYVMPQAGIMRKICRRLKLGNEMFVALPAGFAGKRYDLLYSNTVTNGMLVARLKNKTKKVITHVHEMDSLVERCGNDNWREVLRQTMRFIAVSEPVRDCLLRRGVRKEAIKMLPECASMPDLTSPIDRKTIREELGISHDAFLVGGGGTEVWRKGRDLFVQLAAATIGKGKDRDFHFVWIGPHRDPVDTMWLNHDARLSGCEKVIHWVGSVKNPEAYFSAMDAFAMISREDPLPLVAIEAGMLGVPVVCFAAAGGTAEWVGDEAGFTVPYLDITAMAEKILLLANDRNLLREKGAKARAITRSRYTIDKVGQQFAEYLFQELMNHEKDSAKQ